MKEQLIKLKENQDKLNVYDEKVREIKKKYEAEIAEYKNSVDYGTTLQTISELKDEVTTLAKQKFNETKEKKMIGGIGIREGEEVSYDENKALEWAKAHNLCLALDKKAFKDVIKHQEFDFVNKTPTIKVTFPTKGIKLED